MTEKFPKVIDLKKAREARGLPLVVVRHSDGVFPDNNIPEQPPISFADAQAEREVGRSLDDRISREDQERMQNVAQFFDALGIEVAQDWCAAARNIENFAREFCKPKETRVADSLREIIERPSHVLSIVRGVLPNGLSFTASKEQIFEGNHELLIHLVDLSTHRLPACPDVFRWFLAYSGLDRVMSVEEYKGDYGNRIAFHVLFNRIAYSRLARTTLEPRAFTYICDAADYPFARSESLGRQEPIIWKHHRRQGLLAIEHRFVRDDLFRAAQEAVHESDRKFSFAWRAFSQSIADDSLEWRHIVAMSLMSATERESALTAAKAFAVKGKKMHSGE